jgi:hypothetical protein
VIVGLARSKAPVDLLHDAAGFVVTRYERHRHRRTFADVTAPTVWPPPDTYRTAREIATRVLPGVDYRRHVLFRYSLTWVKPDR